jgi:hypothetical protein
MEKIFLKISRDKKLSNEITNLQYQLFLNKTIDISKGKGKKKDLDKKLKSLKENLEKKFNLNIDDIKLFIKNFKNFLISNS